MIALLGDVHGDMGRIRWAAQEAAGKGASLLIQLGDFGITPSTHTFCQRVELPIPCWFIDGNHEHHDLLPLRGEGLHALGPSISYVPRGSVLEWKGKRLAFLGGADSVDKEIRLRNNWHWSALEVITGADTFRLLDQLNSRAPDVLLTHTPPQSVIERHFDRNDLVRYFGLPYEWTSPAAVAVEQFWQYLGCPPLYCGHMHRFVHDAPVTILDINQLVYL